jgi:hypothetical protein
MGRISEDCPKTFASVVAKIINLLNNGFFKCNATLLHPLDGILLNFIDDLTQNYPSKTIGYIQDT